jgi:hypothetical protein
MIQTSSVPTSRMVYKMLRVEGLVTCLGSLIMAIWLQTPWWLILVGFFAADITLLAYKVNTMVGAKWYNASHTLSIPVPLLMVGIIFNVPWLNFIALIWMSHIGYDRMKGFGLKYPHDFNDGFLQHV